MARYQNPGKHISVGYVEIFKAFVKERLDQTINDMTADWNEEYHKLCKAPQCVRTTIYKWLKEYGFEHVGARRFGHWEYRGE